MNGYTGENVARMMLDAAGLYDFTYEYDDYDYENATVYCPSCGYETGEYGQQYLYNYNSVDCPQCGSTMIEHDIGY